jgi:thiol-disulfide isomerase/thioredoxin
MKIKSVISTGLFLLLALNVAAETIKPFELPVHGETETFKLADALKKGKVLLNFWASWCTSCVQELPLLEALKTKNPGVTFVAINAGDTPKAIAKFLKKYNFSYVIVKDEDKSLSKAMGVLDLPQTWVIGENGDVIFKGNRPPEKI